MTAGVRIGDLLMRVIAEMEGFEADVVKEAEKTGDKAGLTLGQRMGAGIKANGVKAIGLAVASGLAIASKGAIQLQNIQADFQSQTGASAEEAAAAAKTINRVAGEERQSLESVSEAAIKVRRDLGATGDEADALTKDFVRFARVTRQDAGGAVSDFDDILDAWGLTAADSVGIMDKLLVSQQRYGGSITDNQKALAEFAPQLKALGVTVDDGIGLLNLFAASGLDAAKATFALNTAVKNLKPGQTLNDLVAQITAIEDPTLRAQKAIEIFGARGGVSLANVLRPGIHGLDDFSVSAADAAGATERAADVIDSTFTGRIQKAISVASAQLREFGADFGPALTGAAALASLLAPLGGAKLVSAILGPLAGLGGKLKTRIVAAILSAVIPASVAGGLVGDAAAEGVESGVAKGKISGVLTTVLGSTVVTKSIAAVGKVWGSVLGKATVLGAVAIIGAELWQQLEELNKRNAEQAKGIGQNVGDQIAGGTLESLKVSRAALQKGIDDLQPLRLFFGVGAKEQDELKRQLAAVNAEIVGRMEDIDRAAWNTSHGVSGAVASVAEAIDDLPPHVADLASQASPAFRRVGSAAVWMKDRIKDSARAAKEAVHNLTTALVAEAQALITGYYDPIITNDQLAANNREIAAQKEIIASSRSTAAQKRDARDRLTALQKDNAEYLVELAQAGKTNTKAYRDGITELRGEIKKAKGPAKAALQEILDKILEIESAGKVVPINIRVNQKGNIGVSGARAAGGPVAARQTYLVGESGPELFVPRVPGTIVPSGLSMAAASDGPGAGAGDVYYQVHLLDRMPARSVRDIADGLRMVERRGYIGRR